MTPEMILAIAIFVFLLITVAQGVRQVPQGFKWVVQRLGNTTKRLIRVLTSLFHLLTPSHLK